MTQGTLAKRAGALPPVEWGHFVALALSAFPVVVGLASPHDLEKHDQARQALYVLDALHGHIWTPRYLGGLATKPPLYTWLAALVALGFGATEVTVRVPSLAATLGVGVVTYDLGRRLVGREAALWGVALFAVLQHTTKLSFFARTDMLLAFWIALALWAAAVRRPTLFWVAVGLGTLTKGPFGLLIPPLAVGGYALARRDRTAWSELAPLRGIAIVAAIVAVWFVPAFALAGRELWNVLVRHELLRHLAGTGAHGPKSHPHFWILPVYLVLRLLPASLLLPLAGRALRSEGGAWLGVWALTGLVALSVPLGRRADYLLPIYPPVVLLLGRVVSDWCRHELAGRADRVLGWGARAAGLGFGLAALAAAIAGVFGLGRQGPDPPGWALGAGVLGLALAVLAARGIASRRRLLAAALAAQGLCTAAYSATYAAPARRSDAPELRRFAREVAKRADSERLEFYRIGNASIEFLLGRSQPLLDEAGLREAARRPDPTWVVLPDSAYQGLAAEAELFDALGRPKPLLASRPLHQSRNARLLLIRLGTAVRR